MRSSKVRPGDSRYGRYSLDGLDLPRFSHAIGPSIYLISVSTGERDSPNLSDRARDLGAYIGA